MSDDMPWTTKLPFFLESVTGTLSCHARLYLPFLNTPSVRTPSRTSIDWIKIRPTAV